MKHEKSCGAVIYFEENGKRLYLIETMRAGHRSLCKGHMEANETEHETAEREIREETALYVAFRPGFSRTITYRPYPECEKDVVFFLAEAKTTETVAQECEVARIDWLPFSDAAAALTHESDRNVLRDADAFLEGKA